MNQSNRTYLALCLSGILACLSGTAGAAPALIDFGRSATETTGAGDTYNNVYFGDGSITEGGGQNLSVGPVALVDTSNTATGWSIQVAGGDIGNAGGGADVATAPAAISGFEQSAWGDNMFIESGTATISITGLDDSKTYDLLFYGSRTNLAKTQTWSLTKGSGGSNVVHSSNNPTTAVDWTGLSTDGNGEIEFTITTTGQASALNFGSITESTGSPSLAVTSFTATPATLGGAGDAVTFDWAVTGLPLDSLVITPGDIDVLGSTTVAGTGSYLLDPGPDVTTEYTLTATKGGDTAASMVTVTVPLTGTGSQALIDFGRSATETTGASDTYNNVYFGDGSITEGGGQNLSVGPVALVDPSNTATGWSIQVAGGDIGNGGDGGDVATAPAAISGFEQLAWGDNMFIESGTATISITGLDDSKTYALLFYGSRTNLPTTQTWSLTKGSGGSNVVHSSNNPTTVVDWTDLSTDGNGEIEFTIASGQVGALNFGSITEYTGLITSFTATPVTLGAAGDAVTFDWAVTGLPLDSLVITPGDIDVLGDTDGAGVGSYLLDPGPDVTTEYTLTAAKGGEMATRMVSVTVPPPPPDYDVWAADYPGADLSDPNGDYDADGLTNNEERLWGLDPTSGGSVTPINSGLDATLGTLTYTRRNPALTGATFSYQWSTTLEADSWTTFTPASETATGTSPVESVTITLDAGLLANPKLFVRVQIPNPDPPNIVLFLVDDMGLMDTSAPMLADGSGDPQGHLLNDWYRTPSMERLAARGVRFSNFYAHTVCSPSRISVLTGQNSARHRATDWIHPWENNGGGRKPPEWNWEGLQPDDVTLPGVLKQAGYTTIHVGKGHVTPANRPGADLRNLGFDVNIAGSDVGAPASYRGQSGYGAGTTTGIARAVPGLDQYHGTDTFLTEALTLEAKAEIDKVLETDKPFFLYMSHYAVHSPFNSDPRFAANYAGSGLGGNAEGFATLIEGMDKSLGDLMDHLEAQGIAENTLILFLGDNGSDAPLGNHDAIASSAPLRGRKGSRWEGGLRVPFIAGWAKPDPGNWWQQQLPIAAGTMRPEIGNCSDLFPTIMELVNAPVPPDHPVDGQNLATLLAGQADPEHRDKFLSHYPHLRGWGSGNDYLTVYRSGKWKVIYRYLDSANRYELYDLESDPDESTNLASSQPDTLRTMMEAMVQELTSHEALYPVDGSGAELQPIVP